MPLIKIHYGNNISVLKTIPNESVDLIYIDPPFNTGKKQTRKQLRTIASLQGDRIGFKDRRYKTAVLGETSYVDMFHDFHKFIEVRMEEAYRVLKSTGVLFFHLDYREIHYCKILLDGIFGRDSFINEIIWAYDYGARTKTRWPAKHDNILFYAKNPEQFTFNYDEMERIPYMSPGLVSDEKAVLGKTPTDVWWHTIVGTNSREKTGYATQKPIGIINRIVKIHSNPDDILLDFFAGSGTLGEAAYNNGRNAILIDHNPAAILVMRKRFSGLNTEWINCETIT